MPPSLDLRSLFGGFTKPVGNGRANAPEDVERMKKRLNFIGVLDDRDDDFSPIWDRDTDNAVFTFQKNNGLRVDGFARPGGQTNRALQDATILRFEKLAQNMSDDEDEDSTESSFDRRGRNAVDNFGPMMGGLGFGALGGMFGGPLGAAIGTPIGVIIGDLSQGQAEDHMPSFSKARSDGDTIFLRIPSRPDVPAKR